MMLSNCRLRTDYECAEMCKFSSDISFFSDHNEDDQFQYSFQEAFIQLKKKMNVSIYIVYYNQNKIYLTEL